jgi:hypothetical protein
MHANAMVNKGILPYWKKAPGLYCSLCPCYHHQAQAGASCHGLLLFGLAVTATPAPSRYGAARSTWISII